MKHIVMFSGGAASSIVAQIVADKYPKETILLHTPTGAEHVDADRFRAEVANYIGLPITYESASRTLWQILEARKHVPNDSLPWCTEEMKLTPQDRFFKRLEKQKMDFTFYVGIGPDEYRRAQKIFARAESVNRKVEFPLLKAFKTGEDCKFIIRNEWKICLPQAYTYLSHNNCIPCWKGGQGHWYKVYRYYPDRFYRAAEIEEKASNTVFDGMSLYELEEEWKRRPPQEEMFQDSIPCMCAI